MSTGAICRLGLFCFFAFICAHTSYSSTSGLVVFPSTGAVCRFGLFCFFLIFFRPLLVSPLFPFPFICVGPYPVLAMGSGGEDAVPCRFGVGLSALTFVPI